jgi:hypothetical protein
MFEQAKFTGYLTDEGLLESAEHGESNKPGGERWASIKVSLAIWSPNEFATHSVGSIVEIIPESFGAHQKRAIHTCQEFPQGTCSRANVLSRDTGRSESLSGFSAIVLNSH